MPKTPQEKIQETIEYEQALYDSLTEAESLAKKLGFAYFAEIINNMRQEVADNSIDNEKEAKRNGNTD